MVPGDDTIADTESVDGGGEESEKWLAWVTSGRGRRVGSTVTLTNRKFLWQFLHSPPLVTMPYKHIQCLADLPELFRPKLSVIIVAIHRPTGTVPLLSILISLDHASLQLLFFYSNSKWIFQIVKKRKSFSGSIFSKNRTTTSDCAYNAIVFHRYLLVTLL